MKEFSIFLPIFIFLFLFAAVVFDVRQKRTPNSLVLFGIVAGLLLHSWGEGLSGTLDSLLGCLLLLLMTFPFFALGWLGAGDVKLLAAVGAQVTWHYGLAVVLGVFLAGGLLGILALLWKAGLRGFWWRLGTFMSVSLAGRPPTQETLKKEGSIELPYAVAIAVGTLSSLYLAARLPVLVL